MMLKYKYDTQLLIEGDGLNEYENNNFFINNFKEGLSFDCRR